MFFKKKITVAGTLVALVVLGIAASAPADPIFKNLKVLPKNTTHEQLDSVMHMFNSSLGVKCGFCHSFENGKPNFPSDAKPEKDIARYMLNMTGEINAKYFNSENSTRPDTISVVKCVTCHHGNPHPADSVAAKPGNMPPPPPPPMPDSAGKVQPQNKK